MSCGCIHVSILIVVVIFLLQVVLAHGFCNASLVTWRMNWRTGRILLLTNKPMWWHRVNMCWHGYQIHLFFIVLCSFVFLCLSLFSLMFSCALRIFVACMHLFELSDLWNSSVNINVSSMDVLNMYVSRVTLSKSSQVTLKLCLYLVLCNLKVGIFLVVSSVNETGI